MTAQVPKPTACGIEASGWDVNEEFYLETSDLRRKPSGGERLTVHRAVHVGAIVFLRLIQATPLGPSFPVAYQVRTVRRSNLVGGWELDLARLHKCARRPDKEAPLSVPERNEHLVGRPK